MKKLLVATSIIAVSISGLFADHHAADVVGVWHTEGGSPEGGTVNGTLTIKKVEGKLTAINVGQDGNERDIDRVKLDGKTLTLEIDMAEGGFSGVIGAKGKLNADGELKGNWFARGEDGNELFSAEWTALRALDKAATGTWNATAVTDNGDSDHQIILSKSGVKFSGRVEGDAGAIDLEKLSVKKNKITFEFPFGDGTVRVKAAQHGTTKLAGKWHYLDSFGDEAATGKWYASKSKK